MLTKAQAQRVRSLRDKKSRTEQGRFVVEGEKVVGELAAAGFAFLEVYATDAWPGEATQRVSEPEMSRLSHFPTPSSVLAVGPLREAALPAGTLDQGWTLALDRVQDPGNVGTMIRIADWFGLDRVLLSPECADLHSQKVINASMGSFARMAVYAAELAPALAQCSVPVLGCDVDGESVYAFSPPPGGVIVIGSEGRGMSEAVRGRVTRRLTIPRRGGAESLNAAVAAGIVCAMLRR